MNKQHYYKINLNWTGNTGKGTNDYKSYLRSFTVSIDGKSDINGSSDPAFRGDPSKHNPEELLVVSLSSCHMLWFLHLCTDAGIVVMDYKDNATGTMRETEDGGGYFTEVTLYPEVIITDPAKINTANELHTKANKLCFIANSCNFPVHHKPVCKAA